MNCYRCGKPTKFITVIDIRNGIADGERVMMDEDCVRKHLCPNCSLKILEWFD